MIHQIHFRSKFCRGAFFSGTFHFNHLYFCRHFFSIQTGLFQLKTFTLVQGEKVFALIHDFDGVICEKLTFLPVSRKKFSMKQPSTHTT